MEPHGTAQVLSAGTTLGPGRRRAREYYGQLSTELAQTVTASVCNKLAATAAQAVSNIAVVRRLLG